MNIAYLAALYLRLRHVAGNRVVVTRLLGVLAVAARSLCLLSVFDTLGDRRLDEHVLTGLFALVPVLLGDNAERVNLQVSGAL